METKKKKQIMNLIMVALIIVIAGCGVFAVGSVKGWWSKTISSQSALITRSVVGIANIERSGIGYSLKSDMELKKDDLIETKKGAVVEITGTAELALNEKSIVTVDETETSLHIGISEGELFSQLQAGEINSTLQFDEHSLQTKDAVLITDVRAGSSTVSVLFGTVSVTAKDGSEEAVSEGEALSVLTDEDGTITLNKGKLQGASLSDFAIEQAKKCTDKDKLCMTVDELQKILDDRETEKQQALQASLDSDTRIPNTDTDEKKDSEAEKRSNDSSSEEDRQQDSTDSESIDTEQDTGEDSQDQYDEEFVYEDDGSNHEDDSYYEDSSESGNTNVSSSLSCTIEIRCDTILNNMNNLSAGKESYVPSNGVILSTSTVEFAEGDTVFDVLSRVCTFAGIQLEYSWTPVYNSYYIEGINNLYEFDCGNESGWMYKVNGWYPNYGSSSYELQDGDVIVWNYTCNGLGADLGAGM